MHRQQLQGCEVVGSRNLTDADVEALADAIAKRQEHACRYDVDPKALEAAIRFHQHIDKLMAETGSAIRTTLIKAGVSGLIALLLMGIYAMIRQKIGGGP